MSGITGNNPGRGSGVIGSAGSGITLDSGDPGVGTNPAGGLGTVWSNTTSGETYVCTDITPGDNVWTNVGDGTGDIQPWTFGGTQYGFHHGGYNGSGSNMISYYSFTSIGDGVDSGGNLTVSTAWTSAHQNGDHTYGYRFAGWSGLTSMDKYQFSNASAGAEGIGDLANAGNRGTGNSSDTYGFTIGGSPAIIEKLAFASDVDSVVGARGGSATGAYSGFSSSTHGYAAGGGDGISRIDKWSFTSDGAATEVSDVLDQARYGAGGHSSPTAGYCSGGYSTPSYYNIIEKMPFATDVSADHNANLLRAPDTAGSNSSITHGFSCGGNYSGYQSQIDKFPFATETDATDIGDTPEDKSGYNGCGQ